MDNYQTVYLASIGLHLDNTGMLVSISEPDEHTGAVRILPICKLSKMNEVMLNALSEKDIFEIEMFALCTEITI